MSRAEKLKGMKPELTVELTLYAAERGGRKSPIGLGWGCPCTIQREMGEGWVGYDGWPLLGDATMAPGESRRVGYVILSGQQAVDYLSAAEKFYIMEDRIIGEAKSGPYLAQSRGKSPSLAARGRACAKVQDRLLGDGAKPT